MWINSPTLIGDIIADVAEHFVVRTVPRNVFDYNATVVGLLHLPVVVRAFKAIACVMGVSIGFLARL